MYMKLNELTLLKAIEYIKAKKITPGDLYRDVDLAITRDNKRFNIYLSLDKDPLIEARQKEELPLAGIPLAVKDNFLTVGLPTTAASHVLEGFESPYESTVTQRLKKAGGVVIGKTNMDAWAHGSSTETSDYGCTKNPRNDGYLPGGSSGGSAAAVAANMCLAAVGSETAGSIRQPAAWCGVVGIKPTYGRVSRAGVVAMGSSLDSPGPMGKTTKDCAFLLGFMAGKDRYDATTDTRKVPDYEKACDKGIHGMKIGIVYMDHPKLKGTDAERAIDEAALVLSKSGASVHTVSMSKQLTEGKILTPDHAIGVYTVVQRSEVSSNLARYDGVRYGNDRSFFGEEAKRRIMLGTFTLSKGYAEKYYQLAENVRTLYRKNFTDLFSSYDLLITVSSPGYALPVGATKGDWMFGELQDMLLEPSSLAGLPGASIPCFMDKKTHLYLGLNIMADYFSEEKVFAAAHAFEKNTQWNEWANQTYNL